MSWTAMTLPGSLNLHNGSLAIVGLSIAGGALGAFGVVQAGSMGWRRAAVLRTAGILGAWAVGVRLLTVGSIGPFSVGRSRIWLVLMVLALLETVLFSAAPPERPPRS